MPFIFSRTLVTANVPAYDGISEVHKNIDRCSKPIRWQKHVHFCYLAPCASPSFLAISNAVFLSRSIIERKSAGVMY